ncbi:hypothetical protein GGI12_003874 [Dipsacomyces acuminosporus]|nr:hypothetical protein GGI12_003874 [Dipsacomyces acuminosporus]
MAPPPPPAMGGAAPSPPAPPPPPMTSGSAATSVSATAAALASVKLRSTSKDGDSSSASPPPAAPPAPAPAPPAPPSGAPPPPAPTLLGPLRRKELLYVPKVKLKALQWDKLNDMHVDNSLWSKLEDRSGLEEKHVLDTLHGKGVFEQVERMFAAKQAVDLFALREKRRKERAEQEQEEISVLDPKRAYNINIMLGMLKKYSFRDIRNALIRMDTSIISENMLKQLLTFVPTPEERGLLSAYVGRPDRKRLAKPDRFFLETMKVWRYEQRLRVTIAWATWPESFRDMQQDVAAVMTASHAVATSRHFPQVLEVVLSIGNFMNGSGFRGGAFGFKIASLNRLMDTKADDNKTTLLHFVASTIEDNFEEALEFLDELKPVDAGCRVSYAEMKAEMGEMRMRLREAKRELELLRDQRENELKEIAMAGEKPDEENKAEAAAAAQGGSENEESASETEADGTKLPTSSASDPQDRFLLTIRRFLIEANEQYDALSSQFTAMEDSYSNSVLLYGEDPQALAPEEFFGIFKTFTASFNQVNKDNTRERERKKAAEKRRKQIEAQIEQKRLNKQNRANRLAAAANMLNQREMGSDQDSSSMSSIASGSSVSANGAAQGAGAGGENGAVDDLLKSLMAGTDLERVEATKRRRRRELMSIRRRSSLRRSVHRTSISIKALQMLRDIKEEEDPDANDNDGADGASAIPPLPRSSRSILRAHRNAAREKMSTITEDDMHDTSDAAGSQMEDPEAAELREARRRSRRQLLDD